MPPVQRYYFRPTKSTQPQPPRQGIAASAALSSGESPPRERDRQATRMTKASRLLPNGIPVSRLRAGRQRHSQEQALLGQSQAPGWDDLPGSGDRPWSPERPGAPWPRQGSAGGAFPHPKLKLSPDPLISFSSPRSIPSAASPSATAGAGASLSPPTGTACGRSMQPLLPLLPMAPVHVFCTGIQAAVESAAALGALGAATSLAPGTAEPLMDDAFFALIQVKPASPQQRCRRGSKV